MRMIILHGWGHSSTLWQPIVERLSCLCSVDSWDLPGFGAEPLVSAEWGIADYADWVSSKIDQLGACSDEIVLVGHSFGGRISSLLASRRPVWLRALVLIGSPSIYRPSLMVKAKSTIASMIKSVVPTMSRDRFLSDEMRDAEASGLGRIFRKAVTNDQTTTLPMITVPTLLLWGENDSAAPIALAKEIAQLIPRSELVILPGLGHNIHLENPILTYGAIERFAKNIERHTSAS